MSIDERVRALTERGWRIEIRPHLVGKIFLRDLTEWERDAAHWNDQDYMGWFIQATPGTGKLMNIGTYIHTGVAPTIDMALTECERQANKLEGIPA